MLSLEKLKYKIKGKIKSGTPLYPILRKIYRMVYVPSCLLHFTRSQLLMTKLFGLRYSRSRTFIEINLTYRCNLGCLNCNRSLGQGQAPSNEEMTVKQILKFVQESIDNNIKWEKIHISGGEPTFHPNLFEILDILLEYKKNHSPTTFIHLITNGYGEKVKEILQKIISKDITTSNTLKESKIQHFHPFNMAPKDSILYKYVDYSSGCFVTQFCGIGLTPHGYYPCAVAGSIDRVFGFNKGRKKLPPSKDSMTDQLKIFCQFCGRFKCGTPTETVAMSPTWVTAYEKYKKNKVNLSLY